MRGFRNLRLTPSGRLVQGNGPNKLGAVRTEVEGKSFPSKKQAGRFVQLRLLERSGAIADLECDPRIPLVVNGKKVGLFIPDFRYRDLRQAGLVVVEDVKGRRDTKDPVYRMFRLKAALFEALTGVRVVEI